MEYECITDGDAIYPADVIYKCDMYFRTRYVPVERNCVTSSRIKQAECRGRHSLRITKRQEILRAVHSE